MGIGVEWGWGHRRWAAGLGCARRVACGLGAAVCAEARPDLTTSRRYVKCGPLTGVACADLGAGGEERHDRARVARGRRAVQRPHSSFVRRRFDVCTGAEQHADGSGVALLGR